MTILVRRPEDEILLLASDGLWDVLNNQEACTLAKRCLRRARQRGASRQSAARIAATVLTRAAVDRGSRDNVTVTFHQCEKESPRPFGGQVMPDFVSHAFAESTEVEHEPVSQDSSLPKTCTVSYR